MPHGGEVALEVHRDDRVELCLAGVGDHPVPHDAGVIDQHIKSAEGVDGGLDQSGGFIPVSNVGTTGDGFSSSRDDLIDDGLGGATATGRRAV